METPTRILSGPPRAALYCGLGGALLGAVGMAGAHWRWLAPATGFRLALLGIVLGGLLAIVLGVAGLLTSRRRLGQRRASYATLLLGAALLFSLIPSARRAVGKPLIHDVTTDLRDPPAFSQAASEPGNAGRDLTYPHGGPEVPDLQRQAYPELRSLILDQPPPEAFRLAMQTVEELGWTVLWSNGELGMIEAYDESRLFRFVDDVVIRVRESGDGAVVDLRSTSRVGKSDLGANAARILRFTERISAAAASSTSP